MEIIKTTLKLGIEKPFTLLHVTDLHISETDENDSERRREFAEKRKQRYFPFAPEAVAFVKEYVKKTGYPIVNTGDLLDFVTPEGVRLSKELIDETDMMVAVGNHEYWTCPNDRFHYDDAPPAYEKKNETLDLLSRELGVDIRFSKREISGVNIVTMDDSDYCIDADVFEKLREVEKEGKPILLFLHIPLYSEHLGNSAKCSLNPAPQYFENCHPIDVWERTPDDLTREIYDYIRNSPLIRCVISGHVHRNIDVIGVDEQDQLVTGCNTIREITVI